MDTLKQEFSRLIAIDSKSNNYQGIYDKGLVIQEYLQNLPINWQWAEVDGAPDFLIGRSENMSNDGMKGLLQIHLDTVFGVRKDEYGHDDLHIAEDRIYGPGANDALGGALAIVYACRQLHEQGKFKDLVIAFSPEEEIVTPNHRGTIATLADEVDYMMIFEAHAEYKNHGNYIDMGIRGERKGGFKYSIDIKGPGGHSGRIWKKKERYNTNQVAAGIILGAEELANYDPSTQTTLNIGRITNDSSFNVLSQRTTLHGELRSMDRGDFYRAKAALEALVGRSIARTPMTAELIDEGYAPPMELSEQNEAFFDIVSKVGSDIGINVYLVPDGGGVSEANLFQDAAPDKPILDGFGPPGEGEHSKPDSEKGYRGEWCYYPGVIDSADLTAAVVKEMQKYQT